LSLIIESLAEICRRNLLGEKWLIAPSLRVGHQWLDRVTRSGLPVVNVRVQTVSGLAIELARPLVKSKGLDFLTSRGCVILVDGILNRLAREDPGYFTRLPVSLSLAERIYYSVRDLRLAGSDCAALDSGLFEHKEKGEEITRIMQEYSEELGTLKLVDYADALGLAREALTEATGLPDGDSVILLPEDIRLDLSPREKDLLGSFPAEKTYTLEVDTAERSPDASPLRNIDLLSWIGEPSMAPKAVPTDNTVSIFTAAGEINEVREVFRRCLRDGVPLDEVELLHTDGDTYIPLIYELAVRLKHEPQSGNGLNVTFDEGIPASYSRPGKALTAWASWIGEGFLQSTLVKMLEADLLMIPERGDPAHDRLLMPGLLRTVKIGLGRERYVPILQGLVERYEGKLAGIEIDLEEEDCEATESRKKALREIEAARSLLDMAKRLLEMCPGKEMLVGDGDKSAQEIDPKSVQLDILKSARAFLDWFARVADDLDESARHGLMNEIREMESLVRKWGPVNLDIVQWLASLARQVRIMSSGPRPGAIYVTGVDKGGHSGRRHLFIVGLDDSRFPGAGSQDPVVLDSEREDLSRALSMSLPTAKGSLSLKLKRFADLLARISGTITLSFSCRSISDDRETFPSPVVLSAHRIISDDRNADLNHLMNCLPAAASFAPSDVAGCLDLAEWWLSRLCSSRVVEDPEGLLRNHFPHLAKGREAAMLRESPEFTIYDGRVNEPDVTLDPTAETGPRLSSSSLETIGACPRRYFFRNVLGIELPEDVAVDKETWLDPAEFGTLLHEVLYEFVSQRLKTGWPPALPDDLELIDGIAGERCESTKQRTPPPSDAAFHRQSEELLQACRIFLAHESRQKDRQPVFLEACIGLATPFRKGTDLDTTQPVRLKLPNGRTIRVGGRIDRIDRLCGASSEGYVLYDYKSGSAFKYRSTDLFWSGRAVQHGLYVEMADKVLQDVLNRSKVRQFVYFFPGVKEHGLLISYEPEELAQTRTILQSLCAIPARGAFLGTDDPDTDCTYCDYTGICGDAKTVKAQCSPKLNNPVEGVLHEMRELRNRAPKKSK